MIYPTGEIIKKIELINKNSKKTINNNCFLITGSNGWLGRHIVNILSKTNKLYLPVRAKSLEEAKNKITFDLNDNTIIILFNHYSDLKNKWPEVEYVLHIAADMSLANKMEDSWDSNYNFTRNLLELSIENNVSKFDFISTLSVFVSSDFKGLVCENLNLLEAKNLYGGYASTKWACEYLLQNSKTNLNISIHRLGLLSYSNNLGWAKDDGIKSIIDAWKKWGKPDFLNNFNDKELNAAMVDWTETTYAATGIIKSILDNKKHNILHWANEKSISAKTWIDIIEKKYGSKINYWPLNDELGKRATRAMGRFSNPKRHKLFFWHDLFQSTGYKYSLVNSENINNNNNYNIDYLKQIV